MKHTSLWIAVCLVAALILTAPQVEATHAESATPVPSPLPTPTPGVEPPQAALRVREADSMVMVYVPAGDFLMGSPEGEGDFGEHPQHMVTLDAFWIDRLEVTNAQYRLCLEEGVCREPAFWHSTIYNAPDQPVVGVIWEDARTYCEWAGVRLPTEAEWEKAARGTDARTYPWGDEEATCQYAVMNDASGPGCGLGKPWPVGSKPEGVSPYGALDMAGNVSEWVADWYAPDYYSRSPERNPQGPDSGDVRGQRGGGWYFNADWVRAAQRNGLLPDMSNCLLGIRCAASTPSP
jgi:eukaryotic-like serine/threonine-protein kinase